MISFYKLVHSWVPLIIGFMVLLNCCEGAGPPKWVTHDKHGRNNAEYVQKKYSTEENPNVKYNPNLPEELRAKYKGQKWSEQVKADVCSKRPDSGYYCMGAVGDLPPFYQRFYFDPHTQSCRCMLYNGCDGNQNNFRSNDHCMQWCGSNITLFDRRGREKTVYSFAKNSGKCLYFY